METAAKPTPMERASPSQMPNSVGEQPHPTSLRSATFPKGEGFMPRCRMTNAETVSSHNRKGTEHNSTRPDEA